MNPGWVQNRAKVGLYQSYEDDGCIDEEMKEYGEDVWLPQEFHDLIMSLIE